MTVSHLELVGASEAVKLRPHQKNAVWRAIQEGTALFDHVVGAGKTMVCIAHGHGIQTHGLSFQAAVWFPNCCQWRDEFYKLYPAPNILAVADKADFTKQNRERLFGRIATGGSGMPSLWRTAHSAKSTCPATCRKKSSEQIDACD